MGERIENTSSVAPRHLPLEGKAYAKRNLARFCCREKNFTAVVEGCAAVKPSLPLEGKVAAQPTDEVSQPTDKSKFEEQSKYLHTSL
jgi:hypothetical protein